MTDRPRIVCISGSTRFVDVMAVAAWHIESQGAIALGCHLLPRWYTDREHHQAELEGIADAMDALHLAKIELADELVNEEDYIGESTAREIEYATRLGMRISYSHSIGPWMEDDEEGK